MSAKAALVLIGGLCAAALAYSIESRLSEEAFNLLIGVFCGVSASVPVTVGLIIALTRRREASSTEELEPEGYAEPSAPHPPRSSQPSVPQIIVIAPPQNQLPNLYGHLLPPGYNMNEQPNGRDFRIIGEDDDSLEA